MAGDSALDELSTRYHYSNIAATLITFPAENLSMGRTIPTGTMLIESEISRFLQYYGSGLGKCQKEELYNIFQSAKRQTTAIGFAAPRVPFHPILMTILLERQKLLRELEEKITQLEIIS